jgi:hypothetical protein
MEIGEMLDGSRSSLNVNWTTRLIGTLSTLSTDNRSRMSSCPPPPVPPLDPPHDVDPRKAARAAQARSARFRVPNAIEPSFSACGQRRP